MPMKSLVRLTVAVTEGFYLLHFQIVFFCFGKELKQPRFEQFVGLRCF